MTQRTQHNSRLHPEPFYGIQSGLKTSEVRLNDEKRQTMKIGDTLLFTSRQTGEQLTTIIKDIKKYPNFKTAYQNINAKGLYPLHNMSVNELVDYMAEFYSPEEESKYGVLDIQIELIN